jgi:carbamoyltransferase
MPHFYRDPVRSPSQSQKITASKGLENPYMMLSFDTRDNFRELIAAVHNADLSARAQVVQEKHNPEYYRILRLFEEQTGRGVLLNTSYNLHGLPMVNTPEEAMYVFENSGLSHLALGQYMVTKKPAMA